MIVRIFTQGIFGNGRSVLPLKNESPFIEVNSCLNPASVGEGSVKNDRNWPAISPFR